MNTNDLPPAARLAVLIEAGRAANPGIAHGKNEFYDDGKACALGFAALATGVQREQLARASIGRWRIVELAIGIQVEPMTQTLAARVMGMNDSGASLESICQSLREGELAKVSA